MWAIETQIMAPTTTAPLLSGSEAEPTQNHNGTGDATTMASQNEKSYTVCLVQSGTTSVGERQTAEHVQLPDEKKHCCCSVQ